MVRLFCTFVIHFIRENFVINNFFPFSTYFLSNMILQCMTTYFSLRKSQSGYAVSLDQAKHCSKHQKSQVQQKSWKIVLKNIQDISLVFWNFVFCSVLLLEKRRSLIFIYQTLDSTDFYFCFSKNQLKTWHFLVF